MLTSSSPNQIRTLIRERKLTTPTSGFCENYLQANLIVLPKKYRDDFIGLCKRNPVSCPLLGETVGSPTTIISTLNHSPIAINANIATDIPYYYIYNKCKFVKQVEEIDSIWNDNYTGFLIGCSYSFDIGLMKNGLVPRHVEEKVAVPMYKTTIPLSCSGVFSGHVVVSMRPYKPKDIDKVRRVTRQFTTCHGEPIAWGWNDAIKLGIKNINQPDYGDSIEIRNEEIPVFWGCGVTTQVAVIESGIEEEFYSHKPGYMFITDLKE